MAIPLTNAKLSEMGPDLDKGILPLSDKLLKQRSGNFAGNGSISTADLRGTIANTFPLSGTFNRNAKRYVSHWTVYDSYAVLTAKDCTQDNIGKYTYSLTHKGGAADAGVQSYNYGKLPPSGQFIAKFGNLQITSSTSYVFWQAEVIGSKTSWLQGGNKIYDYKRSPGSGWTTDPIDIDPLYPYLTLSMGLFFPGRTTQQSRSGTCTGMEAYLV